MPHKQRPVLGTKTWVAGDLVTAGDLNQQGREHINFLSNRRPHASADNRTTTNTINNNEWTNIKLETVLRDSEAGFTSNGEYVVQISGWYYVTATIVWLNNATNSRGIRFAVNNFPHVSGATVKRGSANLTCGVSLTRMIPLVEGNILTVQGWQDSGGTLDTNLVEPEISFMDLIFYSQFFGFGV